MSLRDSAIELMRSKVVKMDWSSIMILKLIPLAVIICHSDGYYANCTHSGQCGYWALEWSSCFKLIEEPEKDPGY